MILLKKRFSIFFIIFAISILTACSNNEKNNNGLSHVSSDMQESPSYDYILLSDALEKYRLWYKVEGDPYELTRYSRIDKIYVFEDGNVKDYSVRGFKIEDIIDMSDDEIIEAVIDRLHEVETNFEEPEPVEYTLDITLDEIGKDTKFINVETIPKTIFSVIDETTFQTIFDTPFSGLVYNQEDRSDGDEFIITRVEDESVLFTLDNPDTQKNFVTVENAAEIEELREAYHIEERRKLEEEERETSEEVIQPEELYIKSCAACHGRDLEGSAGPELTNIGSKLSEEEIYNIIMNGTGGMPGGLVDYEEATQIAQWLSSMK